MPTIYLPFNYLTITNCLRFVKCVPNRTLNYHFITMTTNTVHRKPPPTRLQFVRCVLTVPNILRLTSLKKCCIFRFGFRFAISQKKGKQHHSGTDNVFNQQLLSSLLSCAQIRKKKGEIGWGTQYRP